MFNGSDWVCTSSVSGKWVDGSDSGDIVYMGGDVGIGTTDPDDSLEVVGGGIKISGNVNSVLEIQSNQYLNPGTAEIRFGQNDAKGILQYETESDIISLQSEVDQSETGNPENGIHYVRSTSNVGIGTKSPDAKLEIESTGSLLPLLESTGTDQAVQLRYKNDAQEWRTGVRADDKFDIYDNTNSASRLTIDTAGNIGIGATSPGVDLQIRNGLFLDSTDSFPGAIGFNRNVLDGSIANSNQSAFQIHHDGTDLYLQTYDGTGTKQGQHVFYEDGDFSIGGNVGIGTTEPDGRLDVVSGSSYGTGLTISRTGNPSQSIISGGNNYIYHGIKPSGGDDSSWVNYMTIEDNGNIGIGSTSPNAKLEINGGDADAEILIVADKDNKSGYEDSHPKLKFSQDGGRVTGYVGYESEEGRNNNLFISNEWNDSTGDLRFRTRDITRMTLDGNGNLGIGTTEPSSTLHVHGEEIRSLNGLCDETGKNCFTPRMMEAIQSPVNGYYVERFTIDGIEYMAIANASIVKVYSREPNETTWSHHHDIDAQYPFAVTYFKFNNQHRLAIAEHIIDDNNRVLPSRIFKWDDWDNNGFYTFKFTDDNSEQVDTNGALSWEHFVMNDVDYLAVANYNGVPTESGARDYTANSTIYRWNSGGLSELTSIATNGARNWHHLEYNGEHFLFLATGSENAKLYSLDPTLGNDSLAEVAELAHKAHEANFFEMNDTTYLAVSSTYYTVELYTFDGTSLTKVQSIPMGGSVIGNTYFSINGEHYLGVTGNNSSLSKIFRWNGSNFIVMQEFSTYGAYDIEYDAIDTNTDGAIDEHHLILTGSGSSRIYRLTPDDTWVALTGQTGVEELTLRDGNVGIGTTDPDDSLEVVGGGIKISGNVNSVLEIQSNQYLNPGTAEIRFGQNDAKGILQYETESDIISLQSEVDQSETGNPENGIHYVRSTSNVGIGTTSPGVDLQIRNGLFLDSTDSFPGAIGFNRNTSNGDIANPNQNAFQIHHNGTDLYLQTYDGTGTKKGQHVFYNNGNVTIAGTVTAGGETLDSDIRYKKEIQTLPSALKNILSLRGVSYYWKDRNDNTEQIGVIAQEVEKIYPQLVHTNEDGYKSVAYSNLVSPLIEAVKELHALYQGHADRIAVLEARIAEQDEIIMQLEEQNVGLLETVVQLEVRLAALEAAQ